MLNELEDRDTGPRSRVKDWIFAGVVAAIGACLLVDVIRWLVGRG